MDALKAYTILREALVDQNHSMIARMTILVTGNSILMIGFFMAVPTIYFSWIRYVLPIVGILFSIAFAVTICVSAKLTVKLADALAKVEQEPEFDYLEERKARIHYDIAGWTSEGKIGHRTGYKLSPYVSIGPILIWSWALYNASQYQIFFLTN